MWSIAHTNDVEIDEIQRANPQLDINHLDVGRRIFLPSVSQVKKVPKPKLNTAQWDRPAITKSANTKPSSPTASYKPNTKVGLFRWPYRGKVLSTYGKRNLKMHNGIDIQIPKNQSILASADGKVVYVGDQIEGYDRVVILLHDNHLFTIYAYVGEFLVQKDQVIRSGTPIAKSQGDSSNAFFHFEIRHVKTSLDPMKFII